MRLRLVRQPTVDGRATFGVLSVDAVPFCFTLEDAIREVPGQAVEAWKIHGRTAIPSGTYAIEVTPSKRFGRALPILLRVPGFEGIRIHPLNDVSETEGCIGVGYARDPKSLRLLRSRVACDDLIDRMLRAQSTRREALSISVVNPESARPDSPPPSTPTA